MIEIIAHNIRSLYNIGALFRNADAFGVRHVHLTGYTATPPRPEIAKTALGADEAVPWSYTENVLEVIADCKQAGKRVLAFEAIETFTPLQELKISGPVVLLFGNEPDGLSDSLITEADEGVMIPMFGTKTSLNVSVASGVALYAVAQKCARLPL